MTTLFTSLEAIDGREVVRCNACSLTQFKPESNCCRKCRRSFKEPEVLVRQLVTRAPSLEERASTSPLDVGFAVRILRETLRLSQRNLALRMGSPRTYVSKVETGRATPNITQIYRLALALETTAYVLMMIATATQYEIAAEIPFELSNGE